MRKLMYVSLSIIIIISLLFQLPSTYPAANEITAKVNVDILNVREGPGLSYNVKTQVRKDETYPIVERKQDWLKLTLSANSTGWVANWLVDENQDEEVQPAKNNLATSTVDGLRIRSGPGTSFQIVGHLMKGQQVPFIEQNENWTKIQFNNQYNWVSSQYISLPEKPRSSKKIGSVTATVLNVRNEPSLSGSVVGKLEKGDSITILSERTGWIEIQFNQQNTWISSDYVNLTEDATNKQTETSSATVTASILNVRDKGSLSGSVIDQVSKGTKVAVLQEVNDWVEIQLSSGTGWVAGWYLQKEKQPANQEQSNSSDSPVVKILNNGTNIRKGPSTDTSVLKRANEGDTFPVVSQEGDWFKLKIDDQTNAYVAGWIVETTGSIPSIERPGIEQYFKNKVVVLDPGHGGRDSGAIGINGTLEKELTLRTAKLVNDKLAASGATVYLTRNNDLYKSLNSRVSTSHYRNADAFISLHYDSSIYRNVRGGTSFYYSRSKDQGLATYLQRELVKNTNARDRGVRYGNLHVLRENKQPAALLELGFLSNPTEELTIKTSNYQEQASNAIYYGLAQFFK